MLLTTQYLDEADRLADRISVIDRGRVIAEGSSDELKDQVGGERLDVTLEDEADAEAAIAALAELARRAPGLRATASCGCRSASARARSPRRSAGSTRPASASTTWPCGGRRSTTCSSRSPATPPSGGGATEERTGRRRSRDGLRYAASDTLVLAHRNLLRIPRAPDLLLSFTVQPIMFVLLFAYVFGGAIDTPGFDYIDFLMPGIVVADDGLRRLRDRARPRRGPEEGADRPLPLAADVALRRARGPDARRRRRPTSLSLAIMVVVGLIIGFSFDAGALDIVAGIGLLLLFGYAFSWVFAMFGLLRPRPSRRRQSASSSSSR